MSEAKKLGITEVVLRDGHQSLLATRLRSYDLLQVSESAIAIKGSRWGQFLVAWKLEGESPIVAMLRTSRSFCESA